MPERLLAVRASARRCSPRLARACCALAAGIEAGEMLVFRPTGGGATLLGRIRIEDWRSLEGEQIIITNADLLRSRLRNFGRMSERRVELTLGVAYETAPEMLERIPSIIGRVVSSQKDARLVRSHLADHGACALGAVQASSSRPRELSSARRRDSPAADAAPQAALPRPRPA